MSQVIEIKDEVFTKLQKNAANDGVSPEAWIEIVVEEKSNGENLSLISDEDRKQMQKFQKRMDKTLSEMWQKKYRKEITEFNERNID